jgi:hypothetical protein
VRPAAVPVVRQSSAEAAGAMKSQVPDAEPIDAAVFSPQQVARGNVFLIQVFLYPPGADEKVDDQARKMDAIAERRGTYSLPLDLPRNTRVDLRLEVPDLIVNEADAVLIWRGRPTAAQFEVTVPATAPGTEAIGRIRFAVAGVPAGTLRFKIALVPTGSAVERGALREAEAVRYRRAFVSYSMQDRAEVLQISGIGATLSERACRRPQYLQIFNLQRHLVSRSTLRIFRSEAAAQWRNATTAA